MNGIFLNAIVGGIMGFIVGLAIMLWIDGKTEKEMDMASDTNTGIEIRPTDNTPKDGDIYSEDRQVARPLTEDEIKDIVDGAGQR